MTPNRTRFCFWFVQTGGHTAHAAIKAGYAPTCAAAMGTRLLRDGAVLELITAQIRRQAPGHEAALRRLLMNQRPKAVRERVAELMLATYAPLSATEILIGSHENAGAACKSSTPSAE